MGQDQAIRTLFITLRRSQAGKPWFHRKVLDALGLHKRLACVEKPNNPSIRGMLRKVSFKATYLLPACANATAVGRPGVQFLPANMWECGCRWHTWW